MKHTRTEVEKDIAVQTPPKRGRLVKAAEAKERSAPADGITPELRELRGAIRRALMMIDRAIEKYLNYES